MKNANSSCTPTLDHALSPELYLKDEGKQSKKGRTARAASGVWVRRRTSLSAKASQSYRRWYPRVSALRRSLHKQATLVLWSLIWCAQCVITLDSTEFNQWASRSNRAFTKLTSHWKKEQTQCCEARRRYTLRPISFLALHVPLIYCFWHIVTSSQTSSFVSLLEMVRFERSN